MDTFYSQFLHYFGKNYFSNHLSKMVDKCKNIPQLNNRKYIPFIQMNNIIFVLYAHIIFSSYSKIYLINKSQNCNKWYVYLYHTNIYFRVLLGSSKQTTTTTLRDCILPPRHIIISRWENPNYLLYQGSDPDRSEDLIGAKVGQDTSSDVFS